MADPYQQALDLIDGLGLGLTAAASTREVPAPGPPQAELESHSTLVEAREPRSRGSRGGSAGGSASGEIGGADPYLLALRVLDGAAATAAPTAAPAAASAAASAAREAAVEPPGRDDSSLERLSFGADDSKDGADEAELGAALPEPCSRPPAGSGGVGAGLIPGRAPGPPSPDLAWGVGGPATLIQVAESQGMRRRAPAASPAAWPVASPAASPPASESRACGSGEPRAARTPAGMADPYQQALDLIDGAGRTPASVGTPLEPPAWAADGRDVRLGEAPLAIASNKLDRLATWWDSAAERAGASAGLTSPRAAAAALAPSPLSPASSSFSLQGLARGDIAAWYRGRSSHIPSPSHDSSFSLNELARVDIAAWYRGRASHIPSPSPDDTWISGLSPRALSALSPPRSSARSRRDEGSPGSRHDDSAASDVRGAAMDASGAHAGAGAGAGPGLVAERGLDGVDLAAPALDRSGTSLLAMERRAMAVEAAVRAAELRVREQAAELERLRTLVLGAGAATARAGADESFEAAASSSQGASPRRSALARTERDVLPLDCHKVLRHTMTACGPGLLEALLVRERQAHEGREANGADLLWAEVLAQQEARLAGLAREGRDLRTEADLRLCLARCGAGPGAEAATLREIRELRRRAAAQRELIAALLEVPASPREAPPHGPAASPRGRPRHALASPAEGDAAAEASAELVCALLRREAPEAVALLLPRLLREFLQLRLAQAYLINGTRSCNENNYTNNKQKQLDETTTQYIKIVYFLT